MKSLTEDIKHSYFELCRLKTGALHLVYLLQKTDEWVGAARDLELAVGYYGDDPLSDRIAVWRRRLLSSGRIHISPQTIQFAVAGWYHYAFRLEQYLSPVVKIRSRRR